MLPGNSSFNLRVRLRVGKETLPRAWGLLCQVNQNEWSDVIQQIVYEWHLLRDLAEAERKDKERHRSEEHHGSKAQFETSKGAPKEPRNVELARFDDIDIGTLNY